MKIDELSVIELGEKIRNSELTCIQVVKKFIENIAAAKHLNALTYFNESNSIDEAARLDAELAEKGPNGVGKLHGVPFVIKDMIHDKNMPCTCACPALKDFWPLEDAPVLQSLKKVKLIFKAHQYN